MLKAIELTEKICETVALTLYQLTAATYQFCGINNKWTILCSDLLIFFLIKDVFIYFFFANYYI